MGEETLIQGGANELLNYGVLGIFCLFLILALVLVWRRMEAKDKIHNDRICDFTEVINTFSINEAQQTEVMKDLKQLIMSKL